MSERIVGPCQLAALGRLTPETPITATPSWIRVLASLQTSMLLMFTLLGETSCWPPSMTPDVAPVSAVLLITCTERGNVGLADDTLDRKRGAQLVAALIEFVAEERCRQGCSFVRAG
jgi:hypothetical protein